MRFLRYLLLCFLAIPISLHAVSFGGSGGGSVSSENIAENLPFWVVTSNYTLDVTFQKFPEVPTLTPTKDYQFATKKYVDDNIIGGAMSQFFIQGDNGSPQTITNGDTVSVLGENGLTSTSSVTDTITIGLDSTTSSNINDAFDHISNDGSDHSFINQAVLITSTPNFGGIKLTPTTNQTEDEGYFFYDDDKKTITLFNDISNTSIQLAREFRIRACNNTGSTLVDGLVVYVDGVDSECPTISTANAKKYNTSRIIGIITADIANGAEGEVTHLGEVNDIDTSSVSTGDIYLTETGGYTNTIPTGDNFIVYLGVCTNSSSTTGTILLNPSISNYTSEIVDTNGFPPDQRSASIMAFNNGSREFSIGPAGDEFHYYDDSTKYDVTSTQTVSIADTEGLHIFYFSGPTLNTIANPSSAQADNIIRLNCIVAYIHWNATDNVRTYFGDERHGISMSPETHSYLHFTRGAQYLQGLAVGDILADENGSLDTHSQFSVALGFTTDEDLISTFNAVASTTGLPVYYLTGSDVAMRRIITSNFSVVTDIDAGVGSTGRLVYNQFTGGAWQNTTVANNDFVLYHVFATNGYFGTDKQVVIMGQNDYGNISAARTGAATEISNIISIFPFEELVPLATIIFQTSDSYSNAVKARIRTTGDGSDYVDWRTTELAQGTPASSHSNLTDLDNDDHLQYVLVDGTRAMTGVLSGTGVSMSATVTANEFVGGGVGLTGLNATQLTSGTVPSARISGSYTGISGVGTLSAGTWQASEIQENFLADDLTILDGTIDDTPIGATTPNTGAFTEITATGQIYTSNTDNSPTTKNITIDFDTGEVHSYDLQSVGADIDITLSNIVTGNTYVLEFIQGATERQFNTITPAVTWIDRSTPNITSTENYSTVVTIFKTPAGNLKANAANY